MEARGQKRTNRAFLPEEAPLLQQSWKPFSDDGKRSLKKAHPIRKQNRIFPKRRTGNLSATTLRTTTPADPAERHPLRVPHASHEDAEGGLGHHAPQTRSPEGR